MEITDPFDPFRQWFRALSKPVQWIVGVPLIAFGISETYRAFTYVPEPGEPKQAIFWTLVLFVVTIALSELLRPKPNIEDQRPAGLGDFQVPTTTEGRVVPLIWGRVRQKGPNVIWYGDLRQDAITEDVKTGIFSSETITKGFRYFLGMQFALCRGTDSAPVTLKRVWIGDDEVFSGTVITSSFDIDQPELFGGDELGSGGVQATCDFFLGSSTQLPSAYLDDPDRQQIAAATTPTCPSYKNTCYLVARQMTSAAATAADGGAYLGNSTSIKPWSFELERFPAIFSGQGSGEHKIGSTDCNPINVVYEILTNNEFGFGFSAADIDVGIGSSFLSAADTMITESNGFSMVLDREMSAKDLLAELQRQIDGVVFIDQSTGKWTIKLARADYDIDLVEQLTDANVAEVRDYTRGSWADTTNTISVQYNKRDDDYKLSYALAQDMANAMIQGDGTVGNSQTTVGSITFPGVKSSALASNLAWRELRGQSYPLARCQLIVNRKFWNLTIGDVIAWTNTQLGFTKLPMRITRIDYGRLESNRMTLTLVQDVFQFASASMGTPPATGWTAPSVSLIAFPTDEVLAEEAPRGIIVRDPKYGGEPNISKVFCAARRQGSEVGFDITERHSSGTPAGTYATAGTVLQFSRIGQLDADLDAGTAIPTATITLTATPDNQTNLEAAFDDTATNLDLGLDLAQLIYVDGEFMLVKDAADNGADVDLQNVYRGVLDTAQKNHAAGTDVFLVHLGAGLTDTNFITTNNVDIALRMKSSAAVFAGSVTPVSLTMAKRAIRPYPPAAVQYNASASNFGTPDVEGDGAGENTYGFSVEWLRRRFDVTNEVDALLSDDTGVDASTEYRVRVFVDPSGANTEIASSPTTWATGASLASDINRLELLDIAAAGTEIRVQIETRHDIGSETNLTSRNNLIHDVVPTSVNDGLFYLGGGISTTGSNSYAAVAAGVFTVRIGAAYGSANVEHRINGGAWSTIIASGGTSGTTASLSITDTIELRLSTGDTPDPNFVELENPSAVRVGYGTF